MPQITFQIEGTTHSVSVSAKDPNKVYRSYDSVIDEVNEAGWEFVSSSEQPDYEELSNIARTSSGQNIDLGDISNRVQPASTMDSTEPDRVGKNDEKSKADISVTVIGPESRSEEFSLGNKQNLGSLKAKISERWNLGLSERVALYKDENRTTDIEGKTDATSVGGKQIYFDILE